jgi:hypothetical protein
MRRLGQGGAVLKSVYHRAVTAAISPMAGLIAAWMCEEPPGSTSLARVVGAGTPMAFVGGTPNLAADSSSFPCSDPLLQLNSAALVALPGAYTSTGVIQLRMLVAVPATISVDDRLLVILTSGTADRWEIRFSTAGHILLQAFDSGVLIKDDDYSFDVRGQAVRLNVLLAQDGSNVDISVSTLNVDPGVGGLGIDTTLTGYTAGRVTKIAVNPDFGMTDTTFGGLTLQDEQTSTFELADQLLAYTGETAVERIERLCGEESVGIDIIGTGSQLVGAQRSGQLLDLLREAETTDQGILYEPRGSADLAYRTLTSVLTQAIGVTIPYADNLLLPFEPIEDDQRTRNKVRAERAGGTFYVSEVTSGPLSTQAPPNGVGLYEDSVIVSVPSDGLLVDQATWRTHIGTADEPRWPRIGIDLAHPTFVADQTLTAEILDLDLGDRIVITNLPSWLPPADVDQLVQGYTETITPKRYKLELNATPARPYLVGDLDDGTTRLASGGSTLSGSHSSAATSLSVAVAGALWSDADGDFDIYAGGKRFTATAITGTSSPQTFTVTPAADGITKTIPDGSAVELADVTYLAM